MMATGKMLITLVLLVSCSATPGEAAQGNGSSTQKPKTLKTVTVSGCFKGYANYDHWVVFMEPLEMYSNLMPVPAAVTRRERRTTLLKNLEEIKAAKQAAFNKGHAKVDSKGTFRLILKNVKSGEYILNFGKRNQELGGMGTMPLKIQSETIDLECHEADR